MMQNVSRKVPNEQFYRIAAVLTPVRPQWPVNRMDDSIEILARNQPARIASWADCRGCPLAPAATTPQYLGSCVACRLLEIHCPAALAR